MTGSSSDLELASPVSSGPVADLAAAVIRRGDLSSAVTGDSGWTGAVLDAFGFIEGRRSQSVIRVLPPGHVALDGRRPQGGVIQVASVDREFIVTSITEELNRRGLRPTRLLSVPFGSTRSDDGAIIAVGRARGAEHTESFVEVELDTPLDAEAAVAVVNDLRRVMAEVFLATDDFAAMKDLILAAAERTTRNATARFSADEVAESVALVEWLLDGHCVLLGVGRYPVEANGDDPTGPKRVGEIDESTALGLLREPGTALRTAPTEVPDRLLAVTRLRQMSAVHRRIPLGRFDLSLVDDQGQVDGIGRLLYVFSRRAEAASVRYVPLLRWKLQQILDDQDAVAGSYDEQAITSLFQALPKDDLFRSSTADLALIIRSLLSEDRDHRVKVLMQAEPASQSVKALITLPSEMYTRSLRQRIERFLLVQLDGERVDVDLSMGGSSDTVARFLVHLEPGAEMPDDLQAVSRDVQFLCRTWEQELTVALRGEIGEDAPRLSAAWADRLPASYRDSVQPEDAVGDVLMLAELNDADPDADGGTTMRVRLASLDASVARLTVAGTGAIVELSRLLPIIESLGLWVVDELHWMVSGTALHRLTVRRLDGQPVDVESDGTGIGEAVVALWNGRTDVDSLNRLVTVVGMSWSDIAVLRAYRRYRRQVDSRYAESYVDDVLVEHGAIALTISQLFKARFGPDGPDRAAAEELTARLGEACDQVSRLDHDRILRGVIGAIEATLRTNLHTRPGGPLALKIDPSAVPDMPHPLPYREIFVHGPTVEGVHLRGGPVARGGLRFSDRPEDYRTEVLDLLRTQVLKNALIVPTGAKGGFVLRRSPAKGVDRPIAVRQAYEAFISGLLDVTDNLQGDDVVPTPGRWDGDDPYLVVAADKGTASFSDVANRIALDRGFWLGDAFASGGSVGYDHRALGITARGAWVAVSRHFAELDVDVSSDPFTVAGVGDMSGDVFGNGMLLSDQIRLVAAFDHRDIFLDPDPDPATTLSERRRLHELSGSSWQQFDPGCISQGGGVYSRSLKRIDLSLQVREVLRTTAEACTPAELIQAVLRAPVDLLYLGGVGTYVRASTESDAQLDDRSNSEVRVRADQLRARVVGEGANLGFTQRARIEYARRGGRINMDAIDNSAGVDTSDHEVNIKILVGLAVESGDVDPAERPELLAGVTDDVVSAVLADSADQSDALGRARDASGKDVGAFQHVQAILVEEGILDPELEALPDDDEYEARRRAGAGLTRPELAVLLAGAKRRVKADVLASDLPDVPAARSALVSYFPPSMAERFDSLLDRHRLRRELVASEIANDLVDHLGPTVAFELASEAEMVLADVAAAYWVVRGVVDSPELWAELAAQASIGRPDLSGDAIEGAVVIAELLTALTRRELSLRRRARYHGVAHDVGARIAEDRPVFTELRTGLVELKRPDAERARRRLVERLVSNGSSVPLAADIALLRELAIAPDVAALARDTGRSTRVVTPAFLRLSDSLGIEKLLDAVQAAPAEDQWRQEAKRGLSDDLLDIRRDATRLALRADVEAEDDGEKIAARWLGDRRDEVDRARLVVARVSADPTGGLDALSVVARALRRVIS